MTERCIKPEIILLRFFGYITLDGNIYIYIYIYIYIHKKLFEPNRVMNMR